MKALIIKGFSPDDKKITELLYNKIRLLVVLLLFSCQLSAQTWSYLTNHFTKVTTGGAYRIEAMYVWNDTLYVGGGFYFALQNGDSIELNSIAAFDGSNWRTLGLGINIAGLAQDFAEFQGYLYMVGSFRGNQTEGITGVPNTQFMARWTGFEWQTAGITSASPTTDIHAIEVYKDTLYVGGALSNVNGFGCCMMRYAGTQWEEVNEGGIIRDMKIFNDELYIAGDVYEVGNLTNIFNIARYDGKQWKEVGAGVPPVRSLGVDTFNNFLYMQNSAGFQRWDGYEIKTIGCEYDGVKIYNCLPVPATYDMLYYHGQLYAGGDIGYDFAGNPIYGLARWDGYQWIPCGTGTYANTNSGGVKSLQIYHDTLYVGGTFLIAGGDSAFYFAKWHTPADTTECSYIQPTIIGSPDTIYLGNGGIAQFHGNIPAATSWNWNFGDSQTATGKDPVHVYTSAGLYSVSMTVIYKTCYKSAYKFVTVLDGVGIEKFKVEGLTFKVYPNPNDGNFTIEIEIPNQDVSADRQVRNDLRSNGKYSIVITDIQGKKVAEQQLINNRLVIENKGWTKGTYICLLLDEGKQVGSTKVVVE